MEIYLHGFATNPEIWHNRPGGEAPELGFENIEKEAARIAKGISKGVTLIGWSMGGMMAMQVAAMVPDKLCALVLVSTTPRFLKSSDFPFGLSPALLRNLQKRIKAEGIKAFHSLVFKNREVMGLADLTPERAEKELAELARVDLRDTLPRIDVPTLIIHGTRDEICLPAAANYMKETIRDSELVMLDGVGHAPMVEAPEEFKRELTCWINGL